MGVSLSLLGSSEARPAEAATPGDPNPERFEIEYLQRIGAFCVAIIRWPDASSFEGRKLAIYRATPDELRSAKRLDPHFQEKTGPLVPIARFEPTERGLAIAVACALRICDFSWPAASPIRHQEV